MYSLLHGVSYNEAIGICVNGRYAVPVLSDSLQKRGQDCQVKTLRNYPQEHDIRFSPGIYKSLRPL